MDAVGKKEEFSIDYNDKGVFLLVYSTEDSSADLLDLVLKELTSKEITEYDLEAINSAIEEKTNKPIKIAEMPTVEEVLLVPPKITVSMTRDRMEANIQIAKDKNTLEPTYEMVMEAINNSNVTYGIDEEAIKAALRVSSTDFLFAKGTKAIPGENAYIVQHVEIKDHGKPAELEHGKVDYKNLNLFTVVDAGTVLAERVPFTNGIEGTDVLGNTLPPKPGKQVMLPLGKNTKALGENTVVASIAGQVILENGKISVVPTIEIKGDVDLSTGNIDFVGSVVVRGSVQAGFTIKAEGDVEVYGTISGGTVEADNIVVKAGIQGMHRGQIKAKGNITSSFVENAVVSAGKDAVIGDAVLHSNVSAGKRVLVQGRKGTIAGGVVTAGEEIVAKVVGTQMNTTTKLEVGINPMLREEYQVVRKELAKAETDLDQVQKSLIFLKSQNIDDLSQEKKEVLLKLTKAQFPLSAKVESLRKKIIDIEQSFEDLKTGRIRVSDVIYPGVKIVIGSVLKNIREEQKYVSFYEEDGDIKTGTF